MTAEVNPADATISLLIDLAQRGEIDPWDVDVIKVIDRFFQDFNQWHLNQANLLQSGQAFLWASMLVSLKADTLEALGEEQPEAVPQEEENPQSEAEGDHQRRKLPQKLERHIRRRGSAPPPQKRRVTLSELIAQLKDLAGQIDDSASNKTQSSRSASKRETAQMISHLAHNENLTELATELEQFLKEGAPQLTQGETWLSLEQLVAWWQQEKGTGSETMTTKSNRVGIFWALLLLSAQSKVELSQQAFYQDINLCFIVEENNDH
ncbi:MAG: segregation/condensation protein A [Cyanobacteria bacterium SW_9_44_58]|nr:MAG: segregation/condensation protein A [Cyanobacteria bacterium SW_9_44_58]